MNNFARRFALAFMAATLLGNAVSNAQSAAEFYRGKTVELMVSAPAGTLTDLVARQFAAYFAKHLPGSPDVIVTNVSGAGGVIAAARLQLESPKDGTVIGFLQRNNLYRSLVENDEDGFDPRQVSWLGSLDKVAYVIAVSGASPVKTPPGLFTDTLILGATGVANDNRTLPAMMNKYLGTRFRIIHGYSGRGEVYLAMERGEVDGWASTIDGLVQPQQAEMIKNGQLIPIMHLAWKSHEYFPELPNLSAYVDDPEVRQIFDFFIAPFEAGRPIAVPSGVPADRLAALREAFDATVADPEFLAAMKNRNWSVDPIPASEVEGILDTLYATPPETLEAVREIVLPPRR